MHVNAHIYYHVKFPEKQNSLFITPSFCYLFCPVFYHQNRTSNEVRTYQDDVLKSLYMNISWAVKSCIWSCGILCTFSELLGIPNFYRSRKEQGILSMWAEMQTAKTFREQEAHTVTFSSLTVKTDI